MALRVKRGDRKGEFLFDADDMLLTDVPLTVIKEADGYCHVIPSCKKCKIVDGICKRCKQTTAQVVAAELKRGD